MISEGVRFDKITVLTLRIRTDRLSKQRRPRSDATERGVWSQSTLYTSLQAILHTFTGSKTGFFKKKY